MRMCNYGDTGGETAAILKLPWKWQVILKVTHLTKWDFTTSTYHITKLVGSTYIPICNIKVVVFKVGIQEIQAPNVHTNLLLTTRKTLKFIS